MSLTRNSKNPEILKDPKVLELLKQGHVVVYFAEPTNNPEFTALYCCQFAENMNSGNGSMSDIQAALLGFNTDNLQRSIINSAAKLKIEPVVSLNEMFDKDLSLKFTDQLERRDRTNTKPRQTSEGVKLVDAETGGEVFRYGDLVEGTPDSINHSTKRVVLESDYKPAEARETSRSKVVEPEP